MIDFSHSFPEMKILKKMKNEMENAERERERERGDERRGGKLITIRKDVKKRSGSRYLTC